MIIFKKRGSLVLGCIFSLMLLSFISFSIYFGTANYHKIKLQNIADASAYSGGASQAKVLNSVSVLNEGIVFINGLITKIVIIWTALRACALLCVFGAGCACLKALQYFEKYARPTLKRLKNLSWSMADLQDQIIEFGKYFVISEVYRIAKENGAKWAIPFPYNPLGNSKSSSTFNFHLRRADRRDIGSSKNKKNDKILYATGKALITCSPKKSETERSYTVCREVSSLLTGGHKLPNPLVLDEDFDKKQKIAVIVSSKPLKTTKGFIDYLKKDTRFYSISQAKPFGPGIFEMKWKAKLERVTLLKEFSNRYLNIFAFGKMLNPTNDLLMH